MEHKFFKTSIDEKEYCCLDITQEFVKRFGKCFAPIESVGVILGVLDEKEIESEKMNILYEGLFSLPHCDYENIIEHELNRSISYGYDSLLVGIDITIKFKIRNV